MELDAEVLKRAERHGIKLTVDGDRVIAFHNDKQVAFAADGGRALDKAIERLSAASGQPQEAAPVEQATPPSTPTLALKPGEPKKTAKKATPKVAEAVPEAKPAAPKKAAEKAEAKPAKPRVTKPKATSKAAAKPVRAPKPKIEGVASGSIIKDKYKSKYRQHGGSCGDNLSAKLKEFLTVKEDGQQSVDLSKLRALAVDNGVWKDQYLSLSPGQQRMTIGNRLRAKLQKGEKVRVGKATLQK